MARVEVRKNELERALRKFKSKVKQAGIIDEIKKREFYEKPNQRRRKEKARAVRREHQRRQREE